MLFVLNAFVKSRLCALILYIYISLMFEFFHIINLDMLMLHKTMIKFTPCNQYIFHTFIILNSFPLNYNQIQICPFPLPTILAKRF